MCVCVRFHFNAHYDAVLSNVDVGTDLRCVDHTVLLDEDVVSDVQREECHPGGGMGSVSATQRQTPVVHELKQ